MDLEANSEEIESEAEQEEFPQEEAAVETFRALEEGYGDQHLAIRCLSQSKKQTQDSSRSRKNLHTGQGQLTSHAIHAWYKGQCCHRQGCTKN